MSGWNGVALLPAAHGDDAHAQLFGEGGCGGPKAQNVSGGIHAAHDTSCIAEAQCNLHRTDAVCIGTFAGMVTPAERLKQARQNAGFDSAAAFADAHDIPEPTYRAHENGTRALTQRAARQYAPILGVTVTWLMFGEDQELSDEDRQIIREFQALDAEDRQRFRGLLRSLARGATRQGS